MLEGGGVKKLVSFANSFSHNILVSLCECLFQSHKRMDAENKKQ